MCQGLHLYPVKMRRLYGVIAILALSRFSLSGLIANCPTVAESAMAQHAHSSSQQAGEFVLHEIAPLGDQQACGLSVRGACAGMTSCTTVAALVESSGSSAAAHHDQVRPRACKLMLASTCAPEPPPPRI